MFYSICLCTSFLHKSDFVEVFLLSIKALQLQIDAVVKVQTFPFILFSISISQSITDWTKCFIGQKKTKVKLRSTDEGRKSLASLLPKFSTKNALSFDIKHIQIEGQDLETTVNNNKASYHHACKNVYNNRMHKRQLEKEKRSSNLESKDILKCPSTKRWLPTASNDVTSNQGICCFCKYIDNQENLVAAGASLLNVVLACSCALRARVFTCSRALRAYVLGVLQKIVVFGMLYKMTCLACYIIWRA